MRFRSKHIADSVVERIQAISDNVRNDVPIPESRGPASVSLERMPDGALRVTKSFENGDPELLTINSEAPTVPDGFTVIPPPPESPPSEAQQVGVDGIDVVSNAALGGDAIDSLLEN